MVVVRRLVFALVLLSVSLAASKIHAVEIADPLTSPKLAEAWLQQKSDKGKASIESGEEGLVIKANAGSYAAIKRRNESVGTDRNPLTASCFVRAEGDPYLRPALILYWDNDNFITLLAPWNDDFYVRWRLDGNDGERCFSSVAKEAEKSGCNMRVILSSRNCFIAIGSDGSSWKRLGDLGFRPKEGEAPGRIILGRGFPGGHGDKNARPDFANDTDQDSKRSSTACFRDFVLRDQPLPLAAAPLDLQAKDSWDLTLESVEAAGIPRNWTMLGPLPDRGFKLFTRRHGLEPDETDNWTPTPKDEAGRPFHITPWARPEDDTSAYVDLGDILEPDTHVLAYARTEIDWPSDGPACLWYDENGRSKLAVNNRWVYADDGRDRHAAKRDRIGIPVSLKKGKNIIKVKSGQNTGLWGFFLRVENNAPAYRIQLLEKLMQLHPGEAASWRGAQAMMEIARRYEELLQFEKAATAWQAAIDKFGANDEYREEAIEGKLRLFESLRDWNGLLAAGGQSLAKHPEGAGSDRAFRACVLAECLLKKYPEAEARVSKYAEQAGRNGQRIAWSLRVLAGAAEASGDLAHKYAALEKIADNANVDGAERARAAFEAASGRCGMEFQRAVGPQQSKPDTASLDAACAEFKKGLALIPGGGTPQVKAWMAEAAADLKAGRHERAAAGCWGAALMALCASDPEAAPYLGLNKSYKLPAVGIDPATKKPREPNDQFKQESWLLLGQALNEVKWQGPGWKAIGPFDNTDGVGERTAYGPETNPDFGAHHPGRGGEKRWIDLDPKDSQELGQTLKGLGNCKDGVAYVAREFDCPDKRTTNLYIAVCAGWTAWIDGKQAGGKSEDRFRIDGNRIPIKLAPGRHRLLLKLACPEDGPFAFRVRISDEPELSLNVLRIAWLQREFPQTTRFYLWYGDLRGMLDFMYNKSNGASMRALGDALAALYSADSNRCWDISSYTLSRLMDYDEYGDAAIGLRALLNRLETGADMPDRAGRVFWATDKLCKALLVLGDIEEVDSALGRFIARYPDFYRGAGSALVERGTLRQDFGIAEGSRPYFARAIREYPNASYNFTYAAPGLAFSHGYLPERLQFEQAGEAQAALDAATRQMKAGSEEDVERAMRNLGEAMRNGSTGMIRVNDSLYVGVREYFRAMLATLDDAMRGIYLKTVAAVSQRRFRDAAQFGNISELEAVAGEYHYTPAAARAINYAGNLYLDRGAYSQAAASFKYLLQEYKGIEGINPALVAAKYARALLLDGQLAGARAAAGALVKDYAGQTLRIGGQDLPAEQFAQSIVAAASRAGKAASNAGSATDTFAGSMQRGGAPLGAAAPRPGPVAWAHTLPQSPGMDQARSRYYPDPFRHVQPFPVVSGGRAYFGSQEGIQALDLGSGRTLWRQAWGTSGSPLPNQFSGFPISCPSVVDGRLCMRALNGRQTVLNCFDAESGRPLWSTAAIPELKHTLWLSDPLVAYGQAIVPYAEFGDRNEHGVASFDLRNGRLRWKTPIVAGSTGLHIGDYYVATTLQLGPPAAERGIVYTATGLNSLAAVNAFSGEVVWAAAYPRTQIRNFTGLTGDLRGGVLKLLARGPASPLVSDETVILAPHDALGVYAFDRKTGGIRWKDELLDSRFIAGLCDGNVLLADSTVKAINAATGGLVWEYHLPKDSLYGRPGYSGGVLYLPGEEKLSLLDAHTGSLIGAMPWDARTGPACNLIVTPKMLVGATESYAVGLSLEGGKPHELPLLEARQAVAAGNLELAASRFNAAIRSGSLDDLMPAVSGWADCMDKLGRKDEALKAIDGLLADKPEQLEEPASQWHVAKSVFAAGLRARLGQPPPEPAKPEAGQPGLMVYAWQVKGDDPRIFFPRNGPQDRFYGWAGNSLYCLRLSSDFEAFWQVYIGPDAADIAFGPNDVAVSAGQTLMVIDRASGEMRWRMPLPTDKKRRRARANAREFGRMALDENSLVFTAGDGLFCYDLRTHRERWVSERRQRETFYLAIDNGKIYEAGSSGGRKRYYAVYDAATGNRINQLSLGQGSDLSRSIQTPDGRILICLPQPNALMAIDLLKAKKLWETHVPNLDVGHNHWMNLRIKDGVLLYNGVAREGPDKGWVTCFIDPANGKIRKKIVGGADLEDKDYVCGLESQSKIVTRVEDNGKGGTNEIWRTVLPDYMDNYHYSLESRLFGSLLYSVYVRDAQGDQYVLRTWDWETGQVLKNEFLPGKPFRDFGRSFRDTFEFHGNLMLYTGSEGIFAYACGGLTRNENAAALKEKLAQPKLAPERRRDLRRALASISPPAMQAFLAPDGARADGDLGEWAAIDPVPLQGPGDYVPLGNDPALKAPRDLSAKLYSAWNSSGVFLAVDVQDDELVPPRSGAPLDSGDSVRFCLNSLSDPQNGFQGDENLVCSMALVDGRSVLNVWPEVAQDADEARISGAAARSPDGHGARYELFIPWPLLRHTGWQRPGDLKELRLGVAAFDDDGDGVKGAVEFGAGVTSPTLAPMRLGLVSLLDISREKIEAYRKVIAKLPDTPEALRFMELILLSKRGPKAADERIAELEAFIKAHPAAGNSNRMFSLLAEQYKAKGIADPIGKTLELARAAKCPPETLDNIKGKLLKVWVLPDAKNPPKMIMLQFYVKDRGWSRRAYWGEPAVNWGRDGTVERKPMGPLPKAGAWTQLEIRPIDLGIEERDIVAMGFTTFGGLLHWDRLSYVVNGKETELMNDAPPAKFSFDGSPLKFVAQPHKAGQKSWTAGPAKGLLNSNLSAQDTWFSFKDPAAAKPPEADPKVALQLYRDAADILPDSPEGLAFFKQALDLLDKKDPAYTANCIRECERYLQAHPGTQHGLALLQMLRSYYDSAGERDPLAKCEELMRKVKLSRDNRRAFYGAYSPTWMEFSAIGPFGAVGERCGMDQSLQPERGVDLGWTTKGYANMDLAWVKHSWAKDGKGKPNASGFIDLYPQLSSGLGQKDKQLLLRAPYFAYAYVKFNAPSKRRAALFFGANDFISIWVNGRCEVNEADPGNGKDRGSKTVQLNNGANEVLIKVGVREQRLGFFFRIADENGRPFDDLTFP